MESQHRWYFKDCGPWTLAVLTAVLAGGCMPPKHRTHTISETSQDYRLIPDWADEAIPCEGSEPMITLDGMMRCGNHVPSHVAKDFDTVKRLTELNGCASWEFTGTLIGEDVMVNPD